MSKIKRIMTFKMNLMSSHFQPDRSLNLVTLKIQLYNLYMKIELLLGNKKKTPKKGNWTMTSLFKSDKSVEIDLIRMVLS